MAGGLYFSAALGWDLFIEGMSRVFPEHTQPFYSVRWDWLSFFYHHHQHLHHLDHHHRRHHHGTAPFLNVLPGSPLSCRPFSRQNYYTTFDFISAPQRGTRG